MNLRGVWAIYRVEMARALRTVLQSIVSPVISTSLYFVVFGSAIGSRITEIDGISYGAFIVPGLIMLSLLTQSISNASFAIYFPKFVGSIYELLSAPVSYLEIVIAYVGGAATKSIILGLIILATASLFVPLTILHPFWMLAFLVLTAVTFSLFGFIIGIWAKSFEQLQLVPLLIITPLTFLGGSFYSINMLPGVWRTVTLFNPVVYLISGFRWSFFGKSDVSVEISLGMTARLSAGLHRDRRLDLQDRLPAKELTNPVLQTSNGLDQAQQPQHLGKGPFAEGDIGRLLDAVEAALERGLPLQVELAAIDPWRIIGAQERTAPEVALGKSAGRDVGKRRQAKRDHRDALLAEAVDGKFGQADLGMRRGIDLLALERRGVADDLAVAEQRIEVEQGNEFAIRAMQDETAHVDAKMIGEGTVEEAHLPALDDAFSAPVFGKP